MTNQDRRICDTCKHNPPSKKWPCVDCDMRNPADRWEPKDVPDTNAGDMVSRRAAIDALMDEFKRVPTTAIRAKNRIDRLPSAQPNLQPTCNNLATDTISKRAAIDEWKNDFKGYVNALNIPRDDYNGIMEYIDELPSAQPERKTGRWLIRKGISDAQCSECKMYFSDVYDMENSDAFCRHCGAKMEGLKVVKRG